MDSTRYIIRRRKGKDVLVDRQLDRYRKYRAKPYNKETKSKLGRPKSEPKSEVVSAYNFFGISEDE